VIISLSATAIAPPIWVTPGAKDKKAITKNISQPLGSPIQRFLINVAEKGSTF
jgi:hypothetical protein